MSTEATQTPQPAAELSSVIDRQVRETVELKRQFFTDHTPHLCACARAMAAAFDHGAHLYIFGNGGSTCEAIHISVEFMHPIIEKRPALPAVSLTTDPAILTAVGNDQDFSMTYVEQLRLLAKPGDVALGLSTSGKSANILRALRWARENGLMTIGFAGRDGGRMPELCDYCLIVPSYSIPRIQESHQTLVHILWDLVHITRGEEDVL